ncbi:MAG: OmpA family protein [Phycisphaerales bacterium]
MAEGHEHQEGEGHEGGSHGGGYGGGHGGGHEEHEGAPEWLISFADNVALLMGFFVILLAMNMAKQTTGGIGGEGQMGENVSVAEADFVIGIREAFNTPISVNSTRAEDQPYIRRILEKRNGGPATQDGPKGRHQSTQSIEKGSYNRVNATINFEDRQALLTDDGKSILAELASRIKDQRWIIEVRGHASPLETMHNQARGRDLSYQRGMAVASALVENGMKWELIRVVACGDSSRVAPRALTSEDDRLNQRVEVIVTNEPVGPDPYAKAATNPEPSMPEGAIEPVTEPGDH